VEAIKGVANVVSDIAGASAEQSGGIDQVNKALTQMDEVTQQNSALVEQNAATAKNLEQQSAAMGARVSTFKLGDGRPAEHAPRASGAMPVTRPARRAQGNLALKEETEF
jgi:methyl-accepting chemotaxis protein